MQAHVLDSDLLRAARLDDQEIPLALGAWLTRDSIAAARRRGRNPKRPPLSEETVTAAK